MNSDSQKLKFNNPKAIEFWDELYKQDDFEACIYKERIKLVFSFLDSLQLPRNSFLLDAGCGTGVLSRQALIKGYQVIGLDYSYGMLVKSYDICKCLDKCAMSFCQGDISRLPLQPASFDVIVCLGVIGYTESEQTAIESLTRALKPGGYMAISIVNKARLVYRLDLPLLIKTILQKMQNLADPGKKRPPVAKNSSSVKTFWIPEFQNSLRRAGLQVIRYKTVPWKLITFNGKEIFPPGLAKKVTFFFEKFINVPFVGSFGGMCIFMVQKELEKEQTGR